MRDRFPNLAGATLKEALTDSAYWDLVSSTVGDVLERNPKCQACAYKGRCLGGCRAKAVDVNVNPDPMGLDAGACRFFLEGYYDRAYALVERLRREA